MRVANILLCHMTQIQPNVVRFYGVFEATSGIYLCTEYVEDGSLDVFLKECDPQVITPAILTNMAAQTAHGLLYLSNKQIVHRDIAGRKNQSLFNELIAKKHETLWFIQQHNNT